MTKVEIGVMSFEEEGRATTKEHRQQPKDEKGKQTDSPLRPPEGTSHANTLT